MLPQSKNNSLLVFLVIYGLLASPLLNFILFQGYSLWKIEVGSIFLGLLVIVGCLVFVTQTITLAILFLVAFAVIFYLETIVSMAQVKAQIMLWLMQVFPVILPAPDTLTNKFVNFAFFFINKLSQAPDMMWYGMTLLVIMLILHKLSEKAWIVLVAIVGVIFASTLLVAFNHPVYPRIQNFEPVVNKQEKLPLLIYIVLDEQSGVDWMPADIPSTNATRQLVKDFYHKYGFLTFGNAYSHSVDSNTSISSILNYSAVSKWVPEVVNKRRVLTHNQTFSWLAAQGYQLRVYQSDYMDFCVAANYPITYCLEYANSHIKILEDVPLIAREKMWLIIGHWLNTSPLATILLEHVRKHLQFMGADVVSIPILGAPYRRTSSLNAMQALEKLRVDVPEHAQGTAFFMHLLLPHFPYAYDNQCQLKTDPSLWLGESLWSGDREIRYQQYYQQMQCLYKKLDDMLSEWKEKGLLTKATVIFHGDHGSRIYPNDIGIKQGLIELPMSLYLPVNRAGFSTIYAVKSPNIKPAQVSLAKPVHLLLQQTFYAPDQLLQPFAGAPSWTHK